MKRLFVAAILLTCGILLAQGEHIPVGMDVRAYSMANIISAGSAGPASMLRNPSGIGWMEKGALSLTGRVNLLGSAGFDEDIYEDSGLEDYSMSQQIHLKLPGIAFATPIPISAPFELVGGIAWGQFFDFSGKIKESYTSSTTNTEYEQTWTNKGGFHLLNPTVAARFANNYVLGLSYGFAFLSNSGYEAVEETSNPNSEEEYETTEKATGSVLQIGAQGRFIDKLNVGLSFAPAFKMKMDDREYKDDSGKYDLNDVKYEFPAYMAFGVAFDVTPDLTVAAEYQNRPYDDLEINNWESGIENGASIRLGVEYRGAVDLRAGFFTDKLMTPSEPGEDTPAGAMGLTAGVGLGLGPVILDLGAYYHTAKWESNTGSGTATEDYKNNLLGLAATATYEIDIFGK